MGLHAPERLRCQPQTTPKPSEDKYGVELRIKTHGHLLENSERGCLGRIKINGKGRGKWAAVGHDTSKMSSGQGSSHT